MQWRNQLTTLFQCLKESYVKAIGIGIGFDLQRLSFKVRTLTLSPTVITRDTTVLVDGVEQPDWSFEETMLDANHYVAVGMKHRKSSSQEVRVVCSFTVLCHAWPLNISLYFTHYSTPRIFYVIFAYRF